MNRFTFAALAATLATSALADMPVSIPFAAEIGGKAFSCSETYAGLGATSAEAKVTDFRMFVSNVALIRDDGTIQPIALDQDGQWQLDTLAMLDFEDATGGCTNGTAGVNTTLRGTVPDGNYTGLSFSVGVPFDQNHVDPTLAASPLNTTAMFWNWQGGYKFLRIDTVPTDKAPDAKGWFLHLGSTVCEAASKTSAPTACANSNRMDLRFDGYDMTKNTVVIDPAPVVMGADLKVNALETSPGCMSFLQDADCMTVMTKLGLGYMDVPAGTQALVSVR